MLSSASINIRLTCELLAFLNSTRELLEISDLRVCADSRSLLWLAQIKHLLIRQKTNRFQLYVSQLCNICFRTGLPQKIHLLMAVAAEFQGGKPPFALR